MSNIWSGALKCDEKRPQDYKLKAHYKSFYPLSKTCFNCMTLSAMQSARAKRQQVKEVKAKGTFVQEAIPAAVRHELVRHARGQCMYLDPDGSRCEARRMLEIDHRVPHGNLHF